MAKKRKRTKKDRKDFGQQPPPATEKEYVPWWEAPMSTREKGGK